MSSRREYESPDIAAAITRQIRALTKRAAEGDLEALTALRTVEHEIASTALPAAAAGAHRFGYSYFEIGRELGISRQAAQQLERKSAS